MVNGELALIQNKEQARIKEEQARIIVETQMQQMAEKLRALGIDLEKLYSRFKFFESDLGTI